MNCKDCPLIEIGIHLHHLSERYMLVYHCAADAAHIIWTRPLDGPSVGLVLKDLESKEIAKWVQSVPNPLACQVPEHRIRKLRELAKLVGDRHTLAAAIIAHDRKKNQNANTNSA